MAQGVSSLRQLEISCQIQIFLHFESLPGISHGDFSPCSFKAHVSQASIAIFLRLG